MSDSGNVVELAALARQAAERYGLPPDIVCAICEHESGWESLRYSYDGMFYVRAIAPSVENAILTDRTEARARAFRWGLMQVSGLAARECKFTGPFTELCEPAAGLEVGCAVLKCFVESAGGDLQVALERWRNGPNAAGFAETILAAASAPHTGVEHTQ